MKEVTANTPFRYTGGPGTFSVHTTIDATVTLKMYPIDNAIDNPPDAGDALWEQVGPLAQVTTGTSEGERRFGFRLAHRMWLLVDYAGTGGRFFIGDDPEFRNPVEITFPLRKN